MNSFRFLERGIKAEIERQTALLERGETVEQETLHFDPGSGRADARCAPRRRRTTTATSPSPTSCRSRRPTEMLEAAARGAARAAGRARRALRARLALPSDDARGCSRSSRELGDYFEAASPRRRRRRRARSPTGSTRAAHAPRATPTRPSRRSRRRRSPSSSRWSRRKHGQRAAPARQVLDTLVAEGGDPAAIVEREGLGAMDDGDELAGIVAAAIDGQPRRRRAHPRRQREGDRRARRPVMRETKGRADGGEVNRLIREQLGV